MSTKIYNAYRVKGSINQLMDLLKKLKEMHVSQSIATYKMFGRNFLEKDFKGILEKDETLESLSENFMGEFILEDIIRKICSRSMNEPLNIDASAVVYFEKGNIYVVFFGLSRNEMGLIRGSDFLEDYHYQNQVDQSNYDWEQEKWNEMSPERQKELTDDWNERRDVWDRLVGDGPFYENGLLFDFVPAGYPMTLMCKEILNRKDI